MYKPVDWCERKVLRKKLCGKFVMRKKYCAISQNKPFYALCFITDDVTYHKSFLHFLLVYVNFNLYFHRVICTNLPIPFWIN
jgi:hypothetical protein